MLISGPCAKCTKSATRGSSGACPSADHALESVPVSFIGGRCTYFRKHLAPDGKYPSIAQKHFNGMDPKPKILCVNSVGCSKCVHRIDLIPGGNDIGEVVNGNHCGYCILRSHQPSCTVPWLSCT